MLKALLSAFRKLTIEKRKFVNKFWVNDVSRLSLLIKISGRGGGGLLKVENVFHFEWKTLEAFKVSVRTSDFFSVRDSGSLPYQIYVFENRMGGGGWFSFLCQRWYRLHQKYVIFRGTSIREKILINFVRRRQFLFHYSQRVQKRKRTNKLIIVLTSCASFTCMRARHAKMTFFSHWRSVDTLFVQRLQCRKNKIFSRPSVVRYHRWRAREPSELSVVDPNGTPS